MSPNRKRLVVFFLSSPTPARSCGVRLPLRRPGPSHGRVAESDAEIQTVCFTHSLLLQPGNWQTTDYGSTAVRWRWRPSIDALQTDVSIVRHFSRIFPAHPRSLARCLSRARRHSAFCFGYAALRVWVSKEKISLRLRPWRARFFLRSLRRKHAFGTWERGTSRRFAQECPEGNPGKYKQEKNNGTL